MSLYCFAEIIICIIHPSTNKEVYKLLGFYLLTEDIYEQMKLSVYLYSCIGMIFSWKCIHHVEQDPNSEIKRIKFSVYIYIYIIITTSQNYHFGKFYSFISQLIFSM